MGLGRRQVILRHLSYHHGVDVRQWDGRPATHDLEAHHDSLHGLGHGAGNLDGDPYSDMLASDWGNCARCKTGDGPFIVGSDICGDCADVLRQEAVAR